MKQFSFLKQLRPSSVGLVNLGCARNLVDSQKILGQVKIFGHRVVGVEKAEIVIVNTCAFIDDAKKETIDTLLNLIDLKKEGKIKKILVTGCFAQRYPQETSQEFKEIDLISGILPFDKKKVLPSFYLTPKSFAYLKICESCYNHCSFCAIPHIKGNFSSRYLESVLDEAKAMDQQGFKEIDMIGQDITAYGMDIYKKKKLACLIRALAGQVRHVRWIRLLYSFPAHIDNELLDVMSSEKKVCPYLDLPLQHISDRILKSMCRRFFKEKIKALIQKIRKKIPNISLRSSFIVGYPGETDKEFQELCSFVKLTAFDRAGVFMYSREDGTKAFRLSGQIPEHIKQQRYEILMKIQQDISRLRLKRLVGQKMEILIDQKEKSDDHLFLGRTIYDAPEVDGVVFVHTKKQLKPGDFITSTITDSYEHDLVTRY